MSVKVDLDQLSDALAEYTIAYLITVGDDFRAHTVAVDPVFADGVVHVGTVGNSTRRNASQHPDVTLVWPPREPGGYTLIVDGRGEVSDDALKVVPSRAVLHRKATSDSAATSPDGLHDCVPL
jgi:hypothetical protein